ncbi:hypothetical protein NQZ68_004702 [Dissostichus eleginoides]|nr:hypothetical protein NQZ68_004702 [Dissostichus eleginoides]
MPIVPSILLTSLRADGCQKAQERGVRSAWRTAENREMKRGGGDERGYEVVVTGGVEIGCSDNCIICCNGSYYNNSDGDLEVWGSVEERPSAVTSARERAGSGRSQGVRGSPPRLEL